MLNLTVFDLQHRFCSLFFQGEVQALFLRHEGYLGAIGAFLKGAEEDSKEKLQIQIILLNLLSTGPLYV